MRHFFLLIIFVSLSIPSIGQVSVGNVDINQSDSIKIVEVLVAEKLSKKFVDVFVDFGQKTNFKSGYLDNKADDQRITDAAAKRQIQFKSAAALLNYMEARNWQHYDSQIMHDSGRNLFYYYFRKK